MSFIGRAMTITHQLPESGNDNPILWYIFNVLVISDSKPSFVGDILSGLFGNIQFTL